MAVCTEYRKLNEEPIEIEYVSAGDEFGDVEPSFWCFAQRYFLGNFIRTHNNPWIGDGFPEYIHGYEADNYMDPLFVEIIGDSHVNVYEAIETGGV